MKLHEDYAVVDVYGIIDGANESFININKTLSQFHYTIIVVSPDEFERKYRKLLGLMPFEAQLQNKIITINAASNAIDICITQKPFDMLAADNNSLLQSGYVMLLKKTFVHYTAVSESGFKNYIDSCMQSVQHFAESLQRSMRVTGYYSFSISAYFACNHFDGELLLNPHITCCINNSTTVPFNARDNYFIRLFLMFEHKLQPQLKKATVLFSNALAQIDISARYLQMLQSLEACFSVT